MLLLPPPTLVRPDGDSEPFTDRHEHRLEDIALLKATQKCGDDAGALVRRIGAVGNVAELTGIEFALLDGDVVGENGTTRSHEVAREFEPVDVVGRVVVQHD